MPGIHVLEMQLWERPVWSASYLFIMEFKVTKDSSFLLAGGTMDTIPYVYVK